MLRSALIGCVALVAGSSLAIGAAQDDVKAAAQKLSDASSYSWKTTVEGGGNRGGGASEGKTEKDGFTMVTLTFGDNTTVVVGKGDKVAVKTEDGWKTREELASDNNGGNGGRNPARRAAGAVRNLPAKTAEELANDAKELTASGDAISGPLSEEGAKKAMMFRGARGGNNANAPEISNAKGDVKFMVKDGVLSGYELHVTGTMSINGNDRDIDRTTKVEFSEIGSTKVEVPEDAKKKIEG